MEQISNNDINIKNIISTEKLNVFSYGICLIFFLPIAIFFLIIPPLFLLSILFFLIYLSPCIEQISKGLHIISEVKNNHFQAYLVTDFVAHTHASPKSLEKGFIQYIDELGYTKTAEIESGFNNSMKEAIVLRFDNFDVAYKVSLYKKPESNQDTQQ